MLESEGLRESGVAQIRLDCRIWSDGHLKVAPAWLDRVHLRWVVRLIRVRQGVLLIREDRGRDSGRRHSARLNELISESELSCDAGIETLSRFIVVSRDNENILIRAWFETTLVV